MKLGRISYLLIALVFTASIMAGCGTKPDVETEAGETTGTKVEAQAETQVAEDVDKGAELKLHIHVNDKYTILDADGKLLPVFQKLEEATGYKLVNVANPIATKSEQEFQMQAAEQFPADIYGGNTIAPEIIKYGMQGGFLALNDLIDKNAPNLKKYLDEHKDVKQAITAPDGNIYYIPYVPDGGVARTYFIRTDWLSDLGLAVPKTVEELEEVLKAFKEKDPNKNGKDDEIPYFNDKWEEAIRLVNLWGARCYGNDSFKVKICMDESGKMFNAWTEDAFKEGIKNMARWYKMGLIDPEFTTRKANTARLTLLTKENRGGFTHDWIASTSGYNDSEELLKIAPNFKFEPFLPPSSSKGPGFEEHQRITVKPDGWAISAQSKHSVAAIKLMDYVFSEEGRRLVNFGVEGISYDMKDGKPIFKEEALKYSGGTNKYLWEKLGGQLAIGYWQDYSYESQWTNNIGAAGVKMYMDAGVIIKNPTPVLNFDKEEKDMYDKVASNLNTYMDEQIQKMVMGLVDVDSGWDAYVAECKKLGSDDLVKLYQSAYDRVKAMK